MTEQDNNEIMTIHQFKEYRLLFTDRIRNCDFGGMASEQYTHRFNEYMDKFIKTMQKQEKIIWVFNAKFDYQGSNILLTNKGKILYIEFNLCTSSCASNNVMLINYEINNHNFDIPSYAICALKMLIKNISGQYTIFSTNDNPKINDNDFNSIYKNINEYLEQLKQKQLQKEHLHLRTFKTPIKI